MRESISDRLFSALTSSSDPLEQVNALNGLLRPVPCNPATVEAINSVSNQVGIIVGDNHD